MVLSKRNSKLFPRSSPGEVGADTEVWMCRMGFPGGDRLLRIKQCPNSHCKDEKADTEITAGPNRVRIPSCWGTEWGKKWHVTAFKSIIVGVCFGAWGFQYSSHYFCISLAFFMMKVKFWKLCPRPRLAAGVISSQAPLQEPDSPMCLDRFLVTLSGWPPKHPEAGCGGASVTLFSQDRAEKRRSQSNPPESIEAKSRWKCWISSYLVLQRDLVQAEIIDFWRENIPGGGFCFICAQDNPKLWRWMVPQQDLTLVLPY